MQQEDGWDMMEFQVQIASESASCSESWSIPGQLLVQIFITEEEEKGMCILENDTVDWRRQNNIPDSDGVELGQTRKRSDSFNNSFW